MDELLDIGSQALRKAALNVNAKQIILENDLLYNTFKKAANRYIGGETLDEAVRKVIGQNQQGFKCSMEFMGESTQTISEAEEATREFVRIIHAIASLKLYSTVSLDLSHIGLVISPELCLSNLHAICSEAAKYDIEVIVSAEGVERTDSIIKIYKEICKTYDNIGITLQAYLYRTKDDFQELVKEKGRIRIVKGAFETPSGVSFPRGNKLDEAYLQYVEQLLAVEHRCSIATHDNKLQQAAKEMIETYKPGKELYEFESLYGIQNSQLLALKSEGHPAKVYFVYGKEWYLYLCNRIAEYPLNIFQALNDIVNS